MPKKELEGFFTDVVRNKAEEKLMAPNTRLTVVKTLGSILTHYEQMVVMEQLSLSINFKDFLGICKQSPIYTGKAVEFSPQPGIKSEID